MNRPGKYLIGLCMIGTIMTSALHGAAKTRTPNPIGVVVVDIQADFVNEPVKDPRTLKELSKQGALGVGRDPQTDKVIAYGDTNKAYLAAAEKFVQEMRQYNMPIFFTQDWHPRGHVSFASTWKLKYPDQSNLIQIAQAFPSAIQLKPEDQKYLVEGQVMWPDHCVQGSPGARILLKVQPQDIVIQKGTNIYADSYSGFQDKSQKATPLTDELHKRGVTDLVIFGIATDFCVHDTAVDALHRGFGVHLVVNLSRGVISDLIDNKLKNLTDLGANIYYIKGLNDGWTPSAATKATLQRLGIIECINVADFVNKLHKNIRAGKGAISATIPEAPPMEVAKKEAAYASQWGVRLNPQEIVAHHIELKNIEATPDETPAERNIRIRAEIAFEKAAEALRKEFGGQYSQNVEQSIVKIQNALYSKVTNKTLTDEDITKMNNAFERARQAIAEQSQQESKEQGQQGEQGFEEESKEREMLVKEVDRLQINADQAAAWARSVNKSAPERPNSMSLEDLRSLVNYIKEQSSAT
jgi:nicotinamidase/pyrazinamidase